MIPLETVRKECYNVHSVHIYKEVLSAMMPEISLNILDVAQNSLTAGSRLTEIDIAIDRSRDTLSVRIHDNGCGMSPEQVERVTDPFFTTRTTRKVGLGIPFFKMAAELSGGSFRIESEKGVGTTTTAVFGLHHIDRMPLGDIAGTMVSLIGPSPEVDFLFRYSVDGEGFVLDTREMRETLEGIPLSDPAVLGFIQDFINENMDALGPRF